MCQAFEGEQSWLLAHDRSVRKRGFDAQKSGVNREDNPEPTHELKEYSDAEQWWLGWDTAAAGSDFW
ncbi:MAG: hypothetical protein ACRBB4_01570 [Neptuniibacter sp.]